jgi:hypothetical protein
MQGQHYMFKPYFSPAAAFTSAFEFAFNAIEACIRSNGCGGAYPRIARGLGNSLGHFLGFIYC